MTHRKRILFISNLFPNPMAPNMAPYNYQQIRALHNFHDIDVIAPIPWIKRLKNTIPIHRQDKGIDVYHPTYFYSPGCLRSLYGYFLKLSIQSLFYTFISKMKYDLVFSSWIYPDGYATAKIADKLKLPFFVKVHGTDINRLCHGDPVTRLTLDVVNKAKGVICVSKALKSRLIDMGAPSGKLSVLYNGIDKEIFFPDCKEDVRKKLCIGPDEVLVVFVGNLKKEKGLEELIKSFKIASENDQLKWKLVIIGKGPYQHTIVRLADVLKLSLNVRFLGSLPLKEVALWMNAASVVCLPSYMEGVPNVVLEALACGTKVVATNIGGIPELDDGTGQIKLIPPKAIEPLALALKNMVDSKYFVERSNSICSWKENACHLNQILFSEP